MSEGAAADETFALQQPFQYGTAAGLAPPGRPVAGKTGTTDKNVSAWLCGYAPQLALPVKPAPPLALHNYLGQPVTLAEYRGKAVLVTFLYTNCPDVCPLIAANLRVALNELGAAASRAQLIAVSVDPRGDTRGAVAKFLREHELLGRMQYLVGSHAQLARTWAAWGVGSQQDVDQPQLVAHSALVYGVGAGGDLRTVYPSSFEPRQIAHDVPLLAER